MKNNFIDKLNLSKLNSAIVFKNVNVVPMDTERIIKNQDVIVEDDKIIYVGDADSCKLPSNARVINGKGKYILPGLTDMHVHICNKNELLLYLANGVTTIRNMWGFKIFGRDLHLELKKEIENGNLLGPKIYTAGSFFDGNPPIWPMSNIVTSSQKAESMVLEEKEKGYDFIKLYSKLSQDNYNSVIIAAEKNNIPAVGHVPGQVSIDHVLKSNQYTIEHLLGYVDLYGRKDLSIPLDKYEEYAVKTKENGIWNCPTITTNQYVCPEEDYVVVDESKFKYMSPYMRKYWGNVKKTQHKIINKFNFQYPSKSNIYRMKMLKSLNQVDAKIILGTDANMLNTLPGFSIHEELHNMVLAGLTPYEAIYAGTHASAECLRDNNNSGTITEGKKADIIMVKDNPLKDISNLKKLDGVMVQGKWISEEKMIGLLEGLAEYYS
jgi:hypothetical protein